MSAWMIRSCSLSVSASSFNLGIGETRRDGFFVPFLDELDAFPSFFVDDFGFAVEVDEDLRFFASGCASFNSFCFLLPSGR